MHAIAPWKCRNGGYRVAGELVIVAAQPAISGAISRSGAMTNSRSR
jgi:hypothetical protein